MKALWLENGNARMRSDLLIPEVAGDESMIAVRRTGVCATDLALRRGYMGFRGVPGHEFVGTVTEGPLEGQRVVGDINAGCGECASCRNDRGHHCAKRSVLGIVDHDGAFAEMITLPSRNLIPVPDHVTDDAAVFTEPLAAALEITEQVDVAGRRALVAGDGRLGLLCAHALALSGADVVCAGRHAERERLLPGSVPHVTGLLETRPQDRSFDIAVEATGNPDALARLVGLVRPRGIIVLKTTTERPASIDLAPIVVDEITVVGSRCGPFDRALQVLADGIVDPTPMIEARYDLDRAVEALEHAGRRGVLKVVVDVAGT